MSIDHDIATVCTSKRCTNLLTTKTECENNLCDLCMFDLREQRDKDEKVHKG